MEFKVYDESLPCMLPVLDWPGDGETRYEGTWSTNWAIGVRAKEFLTLMLLRAMSLLTMRVTGRCEVPQVAGKKALFSVRNPSDSLRTEKSASRRFMAAARLRRLGGVGRF